MYTEKSVELKSDFYARYGETSGRLYFEKVGMPCVMLNGGNSMLVFALDCGVRAYGRAYGDVLRVLNADTNVCDVHFVKNGKGAQILYRTDISDIRGIRETAIYTINKLLYNMGSTGRLPDSGTLTEVCERHAPKGWCAIKDYDTFKSAPLPMDDYNILIIRGRKSRLSSNEEMLKQFQVGERDRISASFEGLKKCNMDTFFDMINESEKAIERLLSPNAQDISLVHATYGIDGVNATRICDCGVVCFCNKNKTDSVILRVLNECRSTLGYSVQISVAK